MQHAHLPSHDNASVSIDPSGTVTVATSLAAQGQGHETTFAQIAADILGVSLENVTVRQGDTDTAPYGMGTFASRSTIVGSGTISLAAHEVRERVLALAARLLETDPGDLTVGEDRVFVRGAAERGIAYADLAGAAHFDLSLRTEDDAHILTATRFYDPPATFSNGCFVVTLEVDVELGTVRIERIVSAEDCGVVINPTLVEGQIYGAVAQAIGGSFLEEMVYGDDGQPLSTNYMDYLLPTATDVPATEIEHLETPATNAIGGVKGMGEGGLQAVPAAVACAMHDALSPLSSAPPERLPFTPDRVLELAGTLEAR
jgi:carbon-monoxide dehydrogenase large subunit